MFFFQAATTRSHFSSRAPGFRKRSLLLSAFILVFLSSLFLFQTYDAYAQDNNAPVDDVIRVDTNLVIVPTIVTDAHGHRVSGLLATDFQLRDSGRSFGLQFFSAGAERVALVFALDASGSARETIVQQRATALALFSRFGKGSRVAVLHFGATANLTVPLTTDADLALAAFNPTSLASRRTAIFDAATTAVRAFPVAGNDPAERRIVILISDGLDTASATKPIEVINEANLRGVSIYVIHLPLFMPRDGHLAMRPTSKGFRELATQTGGNFFTVGDARSALNPQTQLDLAPIFAAIEEDLRGQYLLGYYPDAAARDNRFHPIEINLTQRNPRKLRIKILREGYILKQ